MTMTNILSSVFSVLTLFWLVAVLVALIVGLWFGRAGANNAAYDADCEEAYRDLMSRKFTAKKSEPEIVMISPTEARKVRRHGQDQDGAGTEE